MIVLSGARIFDGENFSPRPRPVVVEGGAHRRNRPLRRETSGAARDLAGGLLRPE